MVRQFLRKRRAAKRIAADDGRDQLLESESGREEYWSGLGEECAKSSLIALLEESLSLAGDIVECGVYRGASLRRICKTIKDNASDKIVFGLDSFEGFPNTGVSSKDTAARLKGKFRDADDAPARLTRFAEAFDLNVDLRKGYFETTLPTLGDRQFCFLHVDCDTYSGHVEVLNALYENIVPGGCIVFDDYKDPSWPGATKAIDEFATKHGVEVKLSEAREDPAWHVIKAGG